MALLDRINSLARRSSDTLRVNDNSLSVGSLELYLLGEFPAEDAEPWDRTGLYVGDPRKTVEKVAIALDPTVAAVERAHAAGATVLVTHHPLFVQENATFLPAECNPSQTSAVVWKAIELGVALMNFHTALDVSFAAQKVLPGMLGLKQYDVLEKTAGLFGKGYGQVCTFNQDESMTLGEFAARCTSVFGRAPRTWGDFSLVLSTVVTCTGSAGPCARKAYEAGYDCIVCGEIKYHEALALAQAGLCIIELGHDTSELPLVAPLAAAVERAGVNRENIIIMEQGDNWRYPEAVRI